MNITPALFEAFLKCPTKCWVWSQGGTDTRNEYATWVKAQSEAYRIEAARRLTAGVSPDQYVTGPSQSENPKTAKWRLAVDFVVRSENLESQIHAVERVPSERRGKAAAFIPIRFIFRNKLTRDDKLLVGLDALVLSEVLGRDVGLGRIVHGENYATLKVKTSALASEVRKQTDGIGTLLSGSTPPDLVLNRHCGECEFQTLCRQKAIEKDDLSLLAGMSEKERKKLHSKGIFTITQLSYAFRPRRRPKRFRDKKEKYHHSLKALAIREKKIHVIGTPELKIEGTPVYLDVEGLPDRDFYYLIGLRIGNGEGAIQHSLWADTAEDEGKIWREFLAILESVENPVLIHYGSYETTFLRRMCERHLEPAPGAVARVALETTINLVCFLFAQVYFPCLSNGLKEIAEYLGFRWPDPTLTGLGTVVRRQQWEATGMEPAKQALLIYNSQDCHAVEALSNAILKLSQKSLLAAGPSCGEVIDVAKLKWEHPYGFKRNVFAFPELDAINSAAYWDYQRQRVYVKSNRALKNLLRRDKKFRKVLLPNATIDCPRPRNCPNCTSERLYKHSKYAKRVFDLKFMRYGIKRWVICYRFHRYQCQQCHAVFQPPEKRWGRSKFGPEIIAYSVYLNIDLRLPQIHVARMLNRLFGFQLDSACIEGFKAAAASKYKESYKFLLKTLCSGRLLHCDETKINIKDKTGFVWVFANMQVVAYVYAETREGELLQKMLKNFTGVLVSDFYAAYDSVRCPQQKCLIHLIRDLNDDLLKHPYDEELKRLAMAFSALLKPMIETADRFGLKSHFLKKHLRTVERFQRQISEANLQSERAMKFRERLEKNRGKLFTFLEYDGVPWNNNNAEHSVKPFAMLRQIIGGVTTEKGLHDYLVLLSICQTCKYMGVDFLDFLRSGEKDIYAFAEKNGRRKRSMPPSMGQPSTGATGDDAVEGPQ